MTADMWAALVALVQSPVIWVPLLIAVICGLATARR